MDMDDDDFMGDIEFNLTPEQSDDREPGDRSCVAETTTNFSMSIR